jgi:hypothetical protein
MLMLRWRLKHAKTSKAFEKSPELSNENKNISRNVKSKLSLRESFESMALEVTAHFLHLFSVWTGSFSLKRFRFNFLFCGFSLSHMLCFSFSHLSFYSRLNHRSFHFWFNISSTHTTDKWLCLASPCLLALIIHELYFNISSHSLFFILVPNLLSNFSHVNTWQQDFISQTNIWASSSSLHPISSASNKKREFIRNV